MNFAINVFGYGNEESKPDTFTDQVSILRSAKDIYEPEELREMQVINLVLLREFNIPNSEKYHYCLIRNLNGFLKNVTYIKCTDCGRMQQKQGTLQEMGILEGNNCPHCGGEVVVLNFIS